MEKTNWDWISSETSCQNCVKVDVCYYFKKLCKIKGMFVSSMYPSFAANFCTEFDPIQTQEELDIIYGED